MTAARGVYRTAARPAARVARSSMRVGGIARCTGSLDLGGSRPGRYAVCLRRAYRSALGAEVTALGVGTEALGVGAETLGVGTEALGTTTDALAAAAEALDEAAVAARVAAAAAQHGSKR